MKILGIMGVVLSSFFFLNCGGEVPTSDPESTEPSVAETTQALLASCEGYDGTRCTHKGPAFACDNGTPDPGACFCTGTFFVCN